MNDSATGAGSAGVSDELRREMKELIIDSLRLEDVDADSIEDDEPLFGDGLGLDSIDALELVSALEYKYKVSIPNEETGKKALASVSALAAFVASAKAEG